MVLASQTSMVPLAFLAGDFPCLFLLTVVSLPRLVVLLDSLDTADRELADDRVADLVEHVLDSDVFDVREDRLELIVVRLLGVDLLEELFELEAEGILEFLADDFLCRKQK